jgi:hypothetical protein
MRKKLSIRTVKYESLGIDDVWFFGISYIVEDKTWHLDFHPFGISIKWYVNE